MHEANPIRPAAKGRLARIAAGWLAGLTVLLLLSPTAKAEVEDAELERSVKRGLHWLVSQQKSRGNWIDNRGIYPTAMTGLAGLALLSEGSTTTQGKYAPQIRRAVDYLVRRSQPNGLIGHPAQDDRYTYGHGFAVLFLSQVLGEEEDAQRRHELVGVLTRAVAFTGKAQTKAGGWGYVSARDGNEFDEGSTTVTQVQALRSCRNAGIPVPKEIIDKAIAYIHRCTTPDGAVQYNSSGGGKRPAISAAAIACLYNAGEYESDYVRKVLKYCRGNMHNLSNRGFGHWHYAHFYYAQVMYRREQEWAEYRDKVYERIIREQSSNGAWTQASWGPVYTTSVNLTILQLEKAVLPIYQR